MLQKVIYLLCAASAVLAIPRPESTGGEAKAAEVDICKLPAVNPSPVQCSGVLRRWTYNSQTGVCDKITYNGCFGTENLFRNEFACLAKCNKEGLQQLISKSDPKAPCMQPKATGTCRAFIPSFFFDTATGLCTQFTYTGCGGNANNFNSEEECDVACNGIDGPVTPPPSAESPVAEVKSAADGLTKQQRCSLPPVEPSPFSCLAFIPSWTFNSTVGECQSFVYGGCGKTANLFESQDACNLACGPEPRILSPHEDTCLQPVVKGPCLAFMPRYAFVKEKNRCEIFTYGGCQGNKNNFITADECYRTCGGDKPNTTPECSQVRCPASNKRFVDMGCRPEYRGKSCCPTRFVCPEEKSIEGVCLYRGVSYAIGQQIPQIEQDDACKTDCACVASDQHRGGAKVHCNQIFCDAPMPPRPDCVFVSMPGSCCGTYSCPEEDQEQATPRNNTCVFNGKTYVKGQTIPTGEPCRRCNCVEGFTGLDGPGCDDVHCVLQNRIGCAPVYTAGVCCPISYKCISAEELSQNRTKIIQPRALPGAENVAVTLPMDLFGKPDSDKPKVKSESCLLPKETGPCRMSVSSFYYDAKRAECIPFVYGGCKGNANRFESVDECLEACMPLVNEFDLPRIIRIESESGHQGVATLPAELPTAEAPLGRGKARVIDVESQPGKAGVSTLPIAVDNNTGELQQGEANSRPERCSQPKVTGPCRGIKTVYFFDSKKEKCVAFNYGGCQGNENRFETVEECRQVCNEPRIKAKPNACQLPVKAGPCEAFVPSFFYNAQSDTCESFIYGGCFGNANRFSSEDECKQTCVDPSPSAARILASAGEDVAQDKFARCKLPADVGYCKAILPRFYYDSVEKQCKTFSYGGCMGNANNFETESECQAACDASEPNAALALEEKDSRARARARARRPLPALPAEEDLSSPVTNVIDSAEPVCTFGNLTLRLGDRMKDSDTPCEECVCSTPPELTCTYMTCPPPPPDNMTALCQAEFLPDQCCPTYSCVSANPPSIDVCEDVFCDLAEEHCEVQAQESSDGSWLPPIGVCVTNYSSIPL